MAILSCSAGALTEHQVVLLLDPGHDRLIELVTTDAGALGDDDAPKGDDRDFSSATADIDDHRPGRLVHRQTDTNGCRHRLLDGVGTTGTCVIGGFLDRVPLDRGDP